MISDRNGSHSISPSLLVKDASTGTFGSSKEKHVRGTGGSHGRLASKGGNKFHSSISSSASICRPTLNYPMSTIATLYLQYRAIFDTAYKVNANLYVCDARNGDVDILFMLKLVVDGLL